jgi:hypothetical protein
MGNTFVEINEKLSDDEIIVEVLGRHNMKTYLLDIRKFSNINYVYGALREFAELPKYAPEIPEN